MEMMMAKVRSPCPGIWFTLAPLPTRKCFIARAIGSIGTFYYGDLIFCGGYSVVTRLTWLNCAKLASANSGMWPSSSWQQSWARYTCDTWPNVTRDTCYRLRGVEGVALVADVLRAVEHAECEAGQEVAWREVARHGPHLDTWPRVTPTRDTCCSAPGSPSCGGGRC